MKYKVIVSTDAPDSEQQRIEEWNLEDKEVPVLINHDENEQIGTASDFKYEDGKLTAVIDTDYELQEGQGISFGGYCRCSLNGVCECNTPEEVTAVEPPYVPVNEEAKVVEEITVEDKAKAEIEKQTETYILEEKKVTVVEESNLVVSYDKPLKEEPEEVPDNKESQKIMSKEVDPLETEVSKAKPATTGLGREIMNSKYLEKAIAPDVLEGVKGKVWDKVTKSYITGKAATIVDIPLTNSFGAASGCDIGSCSAETHDLLVGKYGCSVEICKDDIDDDASIVAEVKSSMQFAAFIGLENGVIAGNSTNGLEGITQSDYTVSVTATADNVIDMMGETLAELDANIQPYATFVLSQDAYGDYLKDGLDHAGFCCFDGKYDVTSSAALSGNQVLAAYLPAYKVKVRKDVEIRECRDCGEYVIFPATVRVAGMLTGGEGVAALGEYT